MSDYLTQLDAWKAHRLERLKAADGWLNVIGRYWLENGTVTVGSAADNDLVLSAGPAHVGTVTQDDEGVTFAPADGGGHCVGDLLHRQAEPGDRRPVESHV